MSLSTIGTAILEAVTLFQQGLPIAESLITDAENEWNQIKNQATITPATIAADDAALDAANTTLQNAKPAT
jgi:hypothetical protein